MRKAMLIIFMILISSTVLAAQTGRYFLIEQEDGHDQVYDAETGKAYQEMEYVLRPIKRITISGTAKEGVILVAVLYRSKPWVNLETFRNHEDAVAFILSNLNEEGLAQWVIPKGTP